MNEDEFFAWIRYVGELAPEARAREALREASSDARETVGLCARCLKATCPGTCGGVSPHGVEKCGHMVLAPELESRDGTVEPGAFLRCTLKPGHGPTHSATYPGGWVWRWFADNTWWAL